MDYDQAIALKPDDATAYYNRGIAYRLQGEWAQAEVDIRRHLEFEPNNWTDWIGLADIARRRGDEAEWQANLTRARELAAPSELYNMACMESVAGNPEQALAFLTQAVAQGKLDAAWARQDPDLIWLRDDPRFEEILAQVTRSK